MWEGAAGRSGVRTRAIVNPRSAGGKTGRRWPELERRLRADLPGLDSVLTEAPGSATTLTRTALAEGIEQILVVGGDGTVNEVVNGFFDEAGRPIAPDAVLAMLMLGTGGDFRKSLGIGPDPEDFIDHLLHGGIRRIDLGRIEMTAPDGGKIVRWFDNITSFGASGSIVDFVNRATFSKKLGGRFAFHWATLRGLLAHRDLPIRVQIDDDFDEVIPATLVAICNGQFFGGGMWIAPNAVLDDGLFDVVLVADLGLFGFVANSGKLYRGTHVELERVRVRRARRVIATPPPGARVALDIDGECPGQLPATYEIVPGALRVRCKEPTP
jgi:diacylglycerol kinase (ATP)